jgi:lipid-A-disaccharide synthase
VDIALVRGDPRTVIAAGDAALCASGTATLEVMLINRPMVMTYKVAPSTYRLGQVLKLVKLRWFSLPNILADEGLVPELIQDDASGENMAAAVNDWLDDEPRRAALRARFDALHEELRCDAAARAAQAVAGVLDASQ